MAPWHVAATLPPDRCRSAARAAVAVLDRTAWPDKKQEDALVTTLTPNTITRSFWDLAGIGASTLCVAHCLMIPLLIVFLPILEAVERQTHAAFALAILAIGLLAFLPGCLNHRQWQIAAAAIVGFGLISLGVTAPEGLLSESSEVFATVLGGLVLVVAHLRNAHFCRRCRMCADRDCAIREVEFERR
jgi:hypothetical protein